MLTQGCHHDPRYNIQTDQTDNNGHRQAITFNHTMQHHQTVIKPQGFMQVQHTIIKPQGFM